MSPEVETLLQKSPLKIKGIGLSDDFKQIFRQPQVVDRIKELNSSPHHPKKQIEINQTFQEAENRKNKALE